MANEITMSASMSYEDSVGGEASMSMEDVIKSSTNKQIIEHIQSVGTSEEAIVLGEVSGQLGYAFFRNLDPTNFVELRFVTGSTKCIRLDPDINADGKGGFAIFKFGSGVSAPYLIADTAACKVRYLLVST